MPLGDGALAVGY